MDNIQKEKADIPTHHELEEDSVAFCIYKVLLFLLLFIYFKITENHFLVKYLRFTPLIF